MDAREALRQYFGYTSFRPGQETLIEALISGRDALGVMPTGAGKSICYQIPALVLDGITLIISPLISLMKDQVAALKELGVAAAYINSSLTPAQSQEALRRAAQGAYKIVYVAPERLDTPSFRAFAREVPIRLFTVDEAHCVSQWGQDFRPSYLRIADFIADLPTRPPVAAFTATATEAVRHDILQKMALRDPQVVVTGFDRPNLRFTVLKPIDKYISLRAILRSHPDEGGIVYCATRKEVEEVCDRLRDDGFIAARYHAGLSDYERRLNQDDFRFDRVRIMVATNAFGMGIDKPNVRCVVHHNMPKDLESYYQEAGRAGRDGEPAECILLYAARDEIVGKWMISHNEPSPELSPVEREALRGRALQRLRQMSHYCTDARCLRSAILSYFGENAPARCDNCSNCRPEFVQTYEVSADETHSRERRRGGRKTRRRADVAASTGELDGVGIRQAKDNESRDQKVGPQSTLPSMTPGYEAHRQTDVDKPRADSSREAHRAESQRSRYVATWEESTGLSDPDNTILGRFTFADQNKAGSETEVGIFRGDVSEELHYAGEDVSNSEIWSDDAGYPLDIPFQEATEVGSIHEHTADPLSVSDAAYPESRTESGVDRGFGQEGGSPSSEAPTRFRKLDAHTDLSKPVLRVSALDEERLYDRLRTLRAQLATSRGVPAYYVFSDASLHAMARLRPIDEASFREVPGVGAAKLKQYAEVFTKVIREEIGVDRHASHARVKGGAAKHGSTGDLQEYKEKLVRAGVASAYQPWTTDEDRELEGNYQSGLSIADLAEAHRRTTGAIVSRLRKLGLL